jgi:hypothetical protein
LVDQIKKNEMGGSCSYYGRRGEMYTGFWWGNLRERDHMEDTGVDGRIIFRKWDVVVWTGSICLKLWTDGGKL